MLFINLAEIKEREMMPEFRAKMLYSENMTVVFWGVKAGSPLPHHSHPNAKITTVTRGIFQFTFDGETSGQIDN